MKDFKDGLVVGGIATIGIGAVLVFAYNLGGIGTKADIKEQCDNYGKVEMYTYWYDCTPHDPSVTGMAKK